MTTLGAGPAHDVLHRADGVQLIGEMAGSGYRVPPSLVRRADGQTIQLTPLLYATLHAVDGRRDAGEVAASVSEATGRGVSQDNVRHLVDTQLRPLGLLRLADGSEPEVKRSNPLLGLRMRYAVSDPERTRRLTDPFTVLFRPLVVVPMLAAFAVICWWVFFEKGLASATYEAFEHPGLLILVFAVTVLSAGFHEFGHAAAARYGGSTPGVMGFGMYLIWPAFYTDVTDSYRLGRGGRVRTDLGGLYINAIVAVAIMGAWWASGYDALLLVVATQILQMLRQLTPLVRFDGYHVLADLTGVPDLFHRIKPTLLGVLPWRWGDPEARLLKPWARIVVTAWVAVVVPLLIMGVLTMVVALPRVAGTAWARLVEERGLLGDAWAEGDLLQVTARVLAMLAIGLPVVGMGYVLVRLVRRTAVKAWTSTVGKPVKRLLAGVLGGVLIAGVAYAWWPHGDRYRPIQPYERGTVGDAVLMTGVPQALGYAPRAAYPSLQVGQQGALTTVWDTSTPLPTADAPQLAVVLVPRDGAGKGATDADAASSKGWVFPFNKPLAPEPGDNQAMAVNTTDGTVTYDVAFALVWSEDGEDAMNVNEAYAFASCKGCAAVAVAFQVVLVVDTDDTDNNVAVPQNLSGAVNYDCVNCLTYALAKQLFLTLDGPLSDEAMAQLDELWAQIAEYGEAIASGDVPLGEITAQLDAYEAQILEIIRADQPAPSSSASPSGSPSASSSGSPGASSSAAAVPSPSAGDGGSAGTSSTGDGSSTTTSQAPSPTASPSGVDSPTATSSGTTSPAPTASASPTG